MNDWKHANHSNTLVYEYRMDNASLVLESVKEANLKGIGAVKQTVTPSKYCGRRVRFKAEISTENTSGSGLWLTASHQDWHITDAMYDRLVVGESDWQLIELVIDVPTETSYLSYGLWMKGNGTCKLRNPKLEVVEESIPVTTTKVWDRVSSNKWVERS